jgi:hypothetical protein
MSKAAISAGLALGLTVSGALPLQADDTGSAIPNFATDMNTAWVLDRTVDDLLAPPSGPGPITFDKTHPYIPNGRGIQPTYRVSDLTNPILQPWAAEQMKKTNDDVLAGKVPFRARERCWPIGTPGFVIYSLVEPFYFYQTPKEVVVVNQGGPEIRHIFMNVPHSDHPNHPGTENPSAIMRMAIRWSSTPSESPTRPLSTITARRTPTGSMSSNAGRNPPTAESWRSRWRSTIRAPLPRPGRRRSAGGWCIMRQ